MEVRVPRLVVLGTLLASALVSPSSRLVAPAGAATRSERPVAALTSTSLGLHTHIDSIDMVTATTGMAVVSDATPGQRHRFYLARTTSAGTSWSVVGPLPYPPVTTVTLPTGPTLDFASSSVGYAATPATGPVFVTTSGGRKWARVAIAGRWPTLVMGTSTLLIVSDRCRGPLPAYGPLRCPSVASLYRVGRTTPETTFAVPDVSRGGWRAAVALALPAPASPIVREGGAQPGSPAIVLASTNAGRTWHRLDNPCHQLLIQQLVTASPRHWLLSCFLDGGMEQGTNRLWSSRDGGRHWALLAWSGEQRFFVGNIADTWNTLAVSGNGRTLFSAVGGAGGGVESSPDGRHWAFARFSPQTGGAPEWIDAFGPTGALFGTQFGSVWRTLDGVTWSPLRLPAGRFHGLEICTQSHGVGASLGGARSVGGTTYRAVTFSNTGLHSCYLSGTPDVQPAVGVSHSPVGPLTTGYSSVGGGYVVLPAHGGRASISLAMQRAASVPRGSCRIRIATGADITFDPPARFYVSSGRRPWTVCALVAITQSTGVSATPVRVPW
ncbi:MAG: DUF4232 domain-containing protein [Acidimicrobiales bacterium]